MRRSWKTLRVVLEDVEEDRLEEKLESFDEEKNQERLASPGTPSKIQEAEDLYYGHLLLALDAGLIEGVTVKTASPYWNYGATSPRLTMRGHDMLDAIRSDTVWGKVEKAASSLSIPITLDLIKTVLASVAKAI